MPRQYTFDISTQPPRETTRIWREYGDGGAGLVVHSRIEGYYAAGLAYREVAVDDDGKLVLTAASSGTEYTEDAPAATDPVGRAVVLVRQDTPAGLVSADGDNVAQRGTNYGAAFVQILTSGGAFVDSFGGGVQYTEGDVDASITGTAMLWEDAADTLRAVSSAKPLPVNVVAGAGGGTAMVDDTAFTPAVSSVTPIGGFADDTAPDSVDEGDTGAVRMSLRRELYVQLRDAAGNERGLNVDANGALAIGSLIPGAGATNLGKAEDAGHTSGDVGVMALAVRNDALGAFTGADLDYSPIAVDNVGRIAIQGRQNEDAPASTAQPGFAMLGVRNDAAVTRTDADSDYSWIATDAAGRVGIADLGGVISVDGGYAEATGSASAVDTDLVSVDAAAYMSVAVFVEGTFTATISFQQSNDNVTWDNTFLERKDDVAGITSATASSAVWYSGPIPARYFRVRTTAYTSGTVTVRCLFAAEPHPMAIQGVSGARAHDAPVSNTNPVVVGAVASAAAPANVSADSDVVQLWALRSGALAVNLTAAGALIPGDATNGLDVDVTRVIPGVTATALGKAEDAGHTTGDTGVMMLGVRNDGATALSGADLDYTPINVDSAGRMRIGAIVPGSGATNLGKDEDAQHTSGDTGVMALAVRNDAEAALAGTDLDYVPLGANSAGRLNVSQVGTQVHDSAVVSSLQQVGYEARTSNPTAVASGDAVRGHADTLGKAVVLPGSVPDLHRNGRVTLTTTTASDVIAAGGAGVRIVVTAILVTNAHGTVGTKVELRDGTTVKLEGQAEENGGGFALDAGGSPLMISTANTAITARCVTTGADVDVFVAGYLINN